MGEITQTPMQFTSIAFVSGKGGVGKTTLATNLAWVIGSAPTKVLIVDLDIQNQGCTGLIASIHNLGETSALGLLQLGSDLTNEPIELTKISPQIAFLPAVSATTEADLHFDTGNLSQRLKSILVRLHQAWPFNCLILDCHGGIDDVSIAAAGLCNHTLIVTEADTVTFTGTLALVDSYYNAYSKSEIKPSIHYIVNRIPPKYKWKDLDRLYKNYLERHLGKFTTSNGILSYFPAEGYISSSFGDYPFQVELAPKALFTRKLELIAFSLFKKTDPKLTNRKIKTRFKTKRRRRKVYRTVLSKESKTVRSVFASYALSALGFLVGLPVLLLSLSLLEEGNIITDDNATNALEIGSWFLFTPIVICLIVSAFRIFFNYRDNLKFNQALFKVLSEKKRFFFRLELVRLWVLYLGSAAVPLFAILLGIAVVIFGY